MHAAASNYAIVDRAFAKWQAGGALFFDLLTDDATVTLAGQSPHSGIFSKVAFLQERAKPFQARFRTAIAPTRWSVWSIADEVIVRWQSAATAVDGRLYANNYAYFITMAARRVTSLTMILDIGAFDEVWNLCTPLEMEAEYER